MVLERNDYLFAGCNNQFLQRIVVCLRDVYLMPDEVVMQARPGCDAIRDTIRDTICDTIRYTIQGLNL